MSNLKRKTSEENSNFTLISLMSNLRMRSNTTPGYYSREGFITSTCPRKGGFYSREGFIRERALIARVRYDSMRPRVRRIVFERHQRSDFFVEKLYGMRARALGAVHACPPRARGRPQRLGCSRSTRRQRRKLDKCCVADKKQTNQQTNKPTNKQTMKRPNSV